MRAKNGNIVLKLLVVLALIGGGVAVALFGFREPAIVQEVTLGSSTDAVTGSIVVHAEKDLQDLKVDLPGRVVWLAPQFDPGKPFKKGDELLKLDTTDIERQIDELKRAEKARLDEAEIRRKRNEQKLLAEKTVADAKRLFELREASAEDVKAAERKLAEVEMNIELTDLEGRVAKEKFDHDLKTLERMRDKMTIVAPVDGVVSGVTAAPGALLNAGSTIGMFYANERVVLASVSEEDFAKVKIGQIANARLLSYPSRTFEGKVTKILPIADPETRRYTVYLEVEAPLELLTPFGTGEVTITIDVRHKVPIFPRRAVFNGTFVYVVKGGRVEKRQIELGYKSLNRVEVAKGLQPGDLVIVEDIDRFYDGQRVRAEVVK
jgi:RND family efflux transporter MFP subunit